MKNMRDFAPDDEGIVESDVLTSIRQLLTDDRMDQPQPVGPVAPAGSLPDAEKAEDQEAALRRRLTSTLRPACAADVPRPDPNDTPCAAPATLNKGGGDLHDLVLAARQALEARQAPGRLRLSDQQRIPPLIEMVSPPLGAPDPAVDAAPAPASDEAEAMAGVQPPQIRDCNEAAPDDGAEGDSVSDAAVSAVLASDHAAGDDAESVDAAAVTDQAADRPDLLDALAQDAVPQLFASDVGPAAGAPDIRSLIRTLIHQELEGALGDRLSRNIHHLMRRELTAAMAEAREGDIWTSAGRG